MPVIIHSCLEPHGSVVAWNQGSITVYISTQSVSGIVRQLSKALNVPASNIQVHADYEGGGFGAKLAADRWGLAAAQLSRLAGGAPVRLVIERSNTGRSSTGVVGPKPDRLLLG